MASVPSVASTAPFTDASTVTSGSSSVMSSARNAADQLNKYVSANATNAACLLVLGVFVAVQAGFAIHMYDQYVKCKYPGQNDKPPIGDVLNVTLFSIILVAAVAVICGSIYSLSKHKQVQGMLKGASQTVRGFVGKAKPA